MNPEYSFGKRPALNYGSFGPGPASYQIRSEKFKEFTSFGPKRAPVYSFGVRLKEMNGGCSPGPASYTLDNKSKNAGFSFGVRYKDLKGDKGPGPSAYGPNLNPVYRKAPDYTL